MPYLLQFRLDKVEAFSKCLIVHIHTGFLAVSFYLYLRAALSSIFKQVLCRSFRIRQRINIQVWKRWLLKWIPCSAGKRFFLVHCMFMRLHNIQYYCHMDIGLQTEARVIDAIPFQLYFQCEMPQYSFKSRKRCRKEPVVLCWKAMSTIDFKNPNLKGDTIRYLYNFWEISRWSETLITVWGHA